MELFLKVHIVIGLLGLFTRFGRGVFCNYPLKITIGHRAYDFIASIISGGFLWWAFSLLYRNCT